MTVAKVSVMLIALLIVVLSALLSACANKGGRGRRSSGYRSGKGFASQIALLSAQTDRTGRSRTGGQGQNSGGARPNIARHRGGTGQGRVEQGMSC